MNRWTVVTALFAVPLIAVGGNAATWMLACFCLAAACHFGAKEIAAREAAAALDPEDLPENVAILDARRDEVSRQAAEMRRRIAEMNQQLEDLS